MEKLPVLPLNNKFYAVAGGIYYLSILFIFQNGYCTDRRYLKNILTKKQILNLIKKAVLQELMLNTGKISYEARVNLL
jgi:hypothetical protein